MELNLQRLSKGSYNKIIFIEKNIDDKNILGTFKKQQHTK
jgi:hypothetical protein